MIVATIFLIIIIYLEYYKIINFVAFYSYDIEITCFLLLYNRFIFFRWVDTFPDGADELSQPKFKNRNSTVSYFFPRIFFIVYI